MLSLHYGLDMVTRWRPHLGSPTAPLQFPCLHLFTLVLQTFEPGTVFRQSGHGRNNGDDYFHMIRLNEATLQVYVSDYTFAETRGMVAHHCQSGDGTSGCIDGQAWIAWGTARDCNRILGHATSNLLGTGFAVTKETMWITGGSTDSKGGAIRSDNGQVRVVEPNYISYCKRFAPHWVFHVSGSHRVYFVPVIMCYRHDCVCDIGLVGDLPDSRYTPPVCYKHASTNSTGGINFPSFDCTFHNS